jgi:biopolymer transport protein ExbB/TolQ
MKQRMSSEFIYQLFALLIAVIVVHAVYVGAIRPSADAQIRQQMELQQAGEDFVPERTFAVVIRDFEQEACFILLIWALAIMGYKARRTLQEQSLLDRRLLDIPEGTSVLPEDAREYSRSLEALPDHEQDFLLPRTLLSALQRFATTGSIQAVSDTIKESCEVESDRLDSELSMVRYIAWAIPSIGFIGTVRGIGDGG